MQTHVTNINHAYCNLLLSNFLAIALRVQFVHIFSDGKISLLCSKPAQLKCALNLHLNCTKKCCFRRFAANDAHYIRPK